MGVILKGLVRSYACLIHQMAFQANPTVQNHLHLLLRHGLKAFLLHREKIPVSSSLASMLHSEDQGFLYNACNPVIDSVFRSKVTIALFS